MLQPLQLAAVPATLVKLVLFVAGSLDSLSQCGRGQCDVGTQLKGDRCQGLQPGINCPRRNFIDPYKLNKPVIAASVMWQRIRNNIVLQAVLIPSVHVGGGDSMPGCFTHEGGVTITKGQLFLWELIMTFVLVSTVYAVAVTKPGHGNIGPLAVGFSLFASAFIGEFLRVPF